MEIYLCSIRQEFRLRVEESARTAEEFTKLYYDTIDKKRHVSNRYIFSRQSEHRPSPITISNYFAADVATLFGQWHRRLER